MMGAKIFSIIALVAILAFIIINTAIVGRAIEETIDEVEACNSYEDAAEARQNFMKYERYINITVSHEDLTSIEDLFSEYEAQMLAQNDDAKITKSRLINALTHLGRLSGVNIDSIL